jgi:hypothetical protein
MHAHGINETPMNPESRNEEGRKVAVINYTLG